jgi:alpha-glucosidase
MARLNLHLIAVALFASFAAASCASSAAPQVVRTIGGNGRTSIAFAGPGGAAARVIDDNGRLKFAVDFQGRHVIEPSPLAFIVDGVDLCAGVANVSSRSGPGDDVNETYPTSGVHAKATDRHHQYNSTVRHAASGTAYTLQVRLFDDGVAYRFILPGKADQQRTPDEMSEFTLPAGSTVWYHGLRGHYEGEYAKHAIEDVKAGDWAGPPMTFKLPGGGGYASITEANLVSYSGMALEAKGDRKFAVGLAHRQPVSYPYELRYSKEDVDRLSHAAKISGDITTPWRVVLVGKDLNTLVNSDVIADLNPPPDSKLFPRGLDSDWVKPGRAVWRYLDNGPRQSAREDPGIAGQSSTSRPTTTASRPTSRPAERVTPDVAKTFSRLAGELGFEYNVLEGFWSRWSDDELRDVVNDAKQHGVRLFVWVHSKNLRDPAARAELFKRVSDAGVAGLKIDFFDHEHKEVIDLYNAILREAAEHHLLLNFHGANKPTGEWRTWPNELTREAVRGMEASRLADRATHDATLPFTRYLAGPADYTPMLFGERRGNTTWAHQIATAAVFTMPLLTYGAHPQNILDNPACDVIKSIPATWDETIVLPPSEIGEVAAMARRKGDDWFVAVVNGTQERSFEVPLSFLTSDGTYTASTVRDVATNAAAVDVKDGQKLRKADVLKIDCAAGGGFVARLKKD